MTSHLEPASGRFDGPVHRLGLRVYFEDTDLSGVVYHANYLRWFERARTEMLRLLGIEQQAVQATGDGAYAVTELSIRYRAPARLDDAIVIESSVVELRAASCRLVQRAFKHETLLAEAELRVGFVGANGRPQRQPDAWRRAFASIAPTEDRE